MQLDDIPHDGAAGGAWPRVIPDFYWILPGKLSAGEYPGAKAADAARVKLRRFLDAQIDCFFDLTEAGELAPYAPILREEAARRGHTVEHTRHPIRDLSTPPTTTLVAILDALDARLDAGRSVYVHCWGGVGRTGTVVGCWLVRHGIPADEALAAIARLRAGTPDGARTSPETEEQLRRVQGWRTGD